MKPQLYLFLIIFSFVSVRSAEHRIVPKTTLKKNEPDHGASKLTSYTKVEEAVQSMKTSYETIMMDINFFCSSFDDPNLFLYTETARRLEDMSTLPTLVTRQINEVRRTFMAHLEKIGSLRRHLIIFKNSGKHSTGSFDDDCSPENQRYRCGNGKCIEFRKVCNGYSECSDNSDEPTTCYTGCYSYKGFRCDSGDCTYKSGLCNGVNDCNDGSDELYC